jgi:NDP-sugar pyrophosphorylase family protein
VTRGLEGGVIAAGDGTRLRADGFDMPKPLVRVGGETLIERAIGNLLAAGAAPVTFIVNEASRTCADSVERRFGRADVRSIVKTTRSSLESFFEVARPREDAPGSRPAVPGPRPDVVPQRPSTPLAAGPGAMLISTVDAVCRAEDVARFAAAATARGDVTVLAVTPLVADEKPLWVTTGNGGRVIEIGREPRQGSASPPLVTAGLYRVPDRVRRMTPAPHLARLRDFLAWLVASGEPVYADVIERVVDVDRREDVLLAQALLADDAVVPSLSERA